MKITENKTQDSTSFKYPALMVVNIVKTLNGPFTP
jgi:hypothetical protein